MLLIKKIAEDIGDIKTCKRITPWKLKELGYLVDERNIEVNGKTITYNIFNILDEDTKKDVSFCFLYSEEDGVGIILPHKFEYYVRLSNR